MEVGPDGHPVGKLYVQRAQSKAERQAELREKFQGTSDSKQQGVNLYVKNLDENTDDVQLRALFEPFGVITSVATPKDDKGKCKGFGFVCFASPDEATKAVTEMHLKVVKGKPLYVGLAEKREVRQERLRQRYSPGAGGFGGPKGAKGGGKGGPGGPQMYGGPQGFPGMGAPMPFQGMPGMVRPPAMGMMPPQAAMYGPRGPMMGPRGPMMGAPPMMGMMGKGGYPMGPGKGGPMMGMPGMGMPGMPMGMPMMGMPGMPGMGMMRPPMPQAGQQGPPAGPGFPPNPSAPLNAAQLAAAPPALQKQMIGEKLFPAIAKHQPELAGKITGMMLEMDNSELLLLLESDQQLKAKVDEAMRVLEGARHN